MSRINLTGKGIIIISILTAIICFLGINYLSYQAGKGDKKCSDWSYERSDISNRYFEIYGNPADSISHDKFIYIIYGEHEE